LCLIEIPTLVIFRFVIIIVAVVIVIIISLWYSPKWLLFFLKIIERHLHKAHLWNLRAHHIHKLWVHPHLIVSIHHISHIILLHFLHHHLHVRVLEILHTTIIIVHILLVHIIIAILLLLLLFILLLYIMLLFFLHELIIALWSWNIIVILDNLITLFFHLSRRVILIIFIFIFTRILWEVIFFAYFILFTFRFLYDLNWLIIAIVLKTSLIKWIIFISKLITYKIIF